MTLWGVFAAHTVSYWLTHRPADARAQHLAATGHSHWDLAVRLAVAGLVIALITSLYRGSRRGHARATPVHGFGAHIVLTVAAFASMEVVERVLSGAGGGSVFSEPAFWVGIAAAVAMATVNALLLRAAEAAGAALGLRRGTPPKRTSSAWAVSATALPAHDLLTYVCWTRGPPHPCHT